MNAQDIIKAAILTDPEKVIDLALQVRPDILVIIDYARAVPGAHISRVAAVAVRYALMGGNNVVSQGNIEAFAAHLAKHMTRPSFLQTKEHEEIMEYFEGIENITPDHREADLKYWQMGAFYKDGRVNERFKAFRAGVSFGKTYFRED